MEFPLRVETQRLALRRLTLEDAAFIVELLNEESFRRNIGDLGVRSPKDARRYLRDGPLASYERFGFGMNRLELKESHEPIGICGLRRRDDHEDVEIGFALLARHRRRGYALEAARETIERAGADLELTRLAAIVDPGNRASLDLLAKLGFERERAIRLVGDETDLDFLARRV